MAIFDFRQVTQQSKESIDEFYRRLKEKSSLCGFHDEDDEIRTQIIHKTADSRLRRKALREQLSLKDIIKYGKTLEQSDVSARKLERIEKREQSTNEATNQIESNNRQYNHRANRHITEQSSRQNTGNKSQQQRAQSCRNCGGPYPHPRGKTSCPASGKECFNCGKIGHFSKHCLSKAKPKQKGQPEVYSSHHCRKTTGLETSGINGY